MCSCTKVQDLRVQSVYCNYVRNNMYYDEAGIIIIFPVLCPRYSFWE